MRLGNSVFSWQVNGLLKAGLVFSASTGTKLIASLLIVKAIAIFVGAEGLGQLGQFMSVMNIVAILAGGGFFTGIMKYVSEHRADKNELSRYFSSGSMMTLWAGGTVALILCLFAGHISNLLLGTTEYAHVIYFLAAAQILIGANNFATSIINGHQDVCGYAICTITGTLVGAALLYVMIMRWGLSGAMYGLVLMPAVMAFFTVAHVFRRNLVSMADLVPRFDRVATARLIRYSGMLLVTVSTLPVSQIIIRNLIESSNGWGAVGYWQGIIRISDAYLLFVHVVLGNYYLPRLSSIQDKKELTSEVYKTFLIVALLAAIMAFSVFVLKDWIIRILFSDSFLPMRDFFLFQMIGDFCKICAYTIGYVAVAKAMTKIYIIAEIFQAVIFVFLSHVFLQISGPVGVTYAYALNYAIYLIAALALFTRYVSSPANSSLIQEKDLEGIVQ